VNFFREREERGARWPKKRAMEQRVAHSKLPDDRPRA